MGEGAGAMNNEGVMAGFRFAGEFLQTSSRHERGRGKVREGERTSEKRV